MKATLSHNELKRKNYTVRIVAISLLAILLLLGLTGCRNRAATVATSPGVAGVYTLASVDGRALPCTLTHADTTMTIQSGTFTITADGRCISSINLAVDANQNMTKVTRASYTQSGDELTMKWERAGTTKGRVNGSKFTMNNEGMIFIYRK